MTYHGNNYLPEGEWNLWRMREVFDCDHVVVRPGVDTLIKMNRIGFRLQGDNNWHAHCGIFTTPIQVAVRYKVPLMMWGEHGFLDLGGMYSLNDYVEFTAKFRLEHALRGYDWDDFTDEGLEKLGRPELKEGLTAKDLLWAQYPSDEEIDAVGVRGVYLGNFVDWDGNYNAKLVMEKYGWRPAQQPFERTYRMFSNLDDMHENGIHDYLKFVKFGYGRGSDHSCKDIRSGKMTREQGIAMVRKYDHVKPRRDLARWLKYVNMSEAEFDETCDTFRDPRVWREENGQWVKDNIWSEPSAYGPVHRRGQSKGGKPEPAPGGPPQGEARLRETEIRPDELMGEQARRYASDVRRLLELKDRFVRVLCPACGVDSPRAAFEKMGFSYVVCTRCETMYVNPRPTSEMLDFYYATSENYAYWNTHIFPASEPVRRGKIFRPRAARLVSICRRHQVKGGTLLEVGAGFGTFCEEVANLKFFDRIIALEPMPALAATCRTKGLEVMEKRIEEASLKGAPANAIASFEVIEHCFDPRQFLASCADLLAPGGLLLLTCPNAKGFDIEILRSLSSAIDTQHLNYFHSSSLSLLVTDAGFDVLEILTPGKLDVELVRKKALSGEFDLSGEPFLMEILLNRWDDLGDSCQQFIADHRLSSHLWLVARKRG